MTVGNDKGKAVDILMNLFRKKYHNDIKLEIKDIIRFKV
jgi:hypothetical protein